MDSNSSLRRHGRLVRITAQQRVEAGSSPSSIEVSTIDTISNFEKFLPGISKLNKANQTAARSLDETVGYGTPLNRFFPGQRVDFLRAQCLAFVVDDLRAAGYGMDLDHESDIALGLLDIFHIVVDVPGYDVQFPEKVDLYLQYQDAESAIKLDVKIELVARHSGDYYFSNFEDVARAFSELDTLMKIEGTQSKYKRELRFVRIVGFDDQSVVVPNIPDIEGVVLIHKVYFGTWLATSGWQWFKRPYSRNGWGYPGFVDN